jgi:hypothetical protein
LLSPLFLFTIHYLVFSINRKDYEHLTKLEIRILQNIESELLGVDKSARRAADKLAGGWPRQEAEQAKKMDGVRRGAEKQDIRGLVN